MESATQLCLVVLFVTTFVNEALGAKDKELYCGGKFQKMYPFTFWIRASTLPTHDYMLTFS